MWILITFLILIIVSFVLALRSMKDLGFASDVRSMLFKRKMKGSIVFTDNKVIHVSSHSSNSSSASSSKETSE